MKFSQDPQSLFSIRKIAPDAIVVGESTLTSSFTILHDRLLENWPDMPLANIDMAYLEPLLAHSPELLIIGSGWNNVLPPRDLLFGLARKGIGLEVMDTPAACRTFNILLAEDRRPAAILYLGEHDESPG